MHAGRYYTPVITAFDKKGDLDLDANRRMWDSLIAGGINGIVVMGSTGEFFALKKEQKLRLIEAACEYVKGRAKLFIGTGNMRIDDTAELSNYAIDAGADGVMIIGPYYFSLSDASIEAYFSKAATEIRGDIFLYNFPDRASYDLKPSIALKLLKKHGNIVGYKDTVDAMSHTRKLITTVRAESDDFIILSGKDENYAHTIMSGGDGCIGGFSNLYPDLCGAMRTALDNKEMDKVAEIQAVMDRVCDFGGIGMPFIPILKKAIQLRGKVEIDDTCQFPFLTANEAETAEIKALLDELEPHVKALVS
jgi:4-hydroxy-tetrahydrodipicolinate synthase